jgi:superfamily II DNA/RNA helicase
MSHGVEVLVATPGRLLDLVNSRAVRLDKIEVLVLDEADRMLDMGFIHDIKRIIALLPKERHTLFFSATMPQEITRLADQMLRDPAKVSVTPQASTAERVDQRVILTERAAKQALLAEIIKSENTDRVLVFTRTKHGADKVVRGLEKSGIRAEAIHGNKSQNQRERVLAAFRDGSLKTLVATDIAARGIDVDGVSHVINYDLPNIPESYVHRIGRTARAGAEGVAISLCSHDELPFLRDIEKLIRMAIPATGQVSRPAAGAPRPQQPRNGRSHNGQSRNNGHNRNGQQARNGQSRNERTRNGENRNANQPGRPERNPQRPHNHNPKHTAQPHQQRQDQRQASHDRRPAGAPAGDVGNDIARVAFMQHR